MFQPISRRYLSGRHVLRALSILVFVVAGCAGGIPKNLDSPEELLAAADARYQRGKYTQAQEIYKLFLQRYPGDARSDYAQFMMGECLYENEEWPLAAVEYRILMTNYGYSDYVDDAVFKEALCVHEQAGRVERDQTKNRDALDKLERFVQVFPSSPYVPQAREMIKEIHTILAEKAFETATYYNRRRRYTSALIYLDKIVDNYPDNRYWALALYEKGRILKRRGEDEEAIRALSAMLAYPEDMPEKKSARALLRELTE